MRAMAWVAVVLALVCGSSRMARAEDAPVPRRERDQQDRDQMMSPRDRMMMRGNPFEGSLRPSQEAQLKVKLSQRFGVAPETIDALRNKHDLNYAEVRELLQLAMQLGGPTPKNLDKILAHRVDGQKSFRARGEISLPSRLIVTTDNVQRLRVDRRKLPFKRGRSVALLIDGQGIELTGRHDIVEIVRSRNGDWSPANPITGP